MKHGDGDFDSSALLDQFYVDREELLQRVLASLGRHDQVALDQVVRHRPLEQGLAELVGYLSLQQADLDVIFDEDRRSQVSWATDNGKRVADLPTVTFARRADEEEL